MEVILKPGVFVGCRERRDWKVFLGGGRSKEAPTPSGGLRTRAPSPTPLVRAGLTAKLSHRRGACKQEGNTDPKERYWAEGARGGSVTSLLISIKFYQRRKRLQEGVGSFS